jgi:preprotein translocase subunit SecF
MKQLTITTRNKYLFLCAMLALLVGQITGSFNIALLMGICIGIGVFVGENS